MENIVIGIKENFSTTAYVMLYSLLENNIDIFFNIYILSDKLDINIFKPLEKNFNCNIKLYIIDIEDIKNLNFRHIDTSTFYRLKMDKYLPKNLERVLYLDTDMVIDGEIKELFNKKFQENKIVMAVECKISKKHLEKVGFKNEKYFNAGMLYFDYQSCLKENIFERALNLLLEDDSKYDFMDQDVLNITLKGRVEYINPKWNYGSFFAVSELLGEKIEEKPIILHYTGIEKPWNYMNINKYSDVYKYYFEKIFEKKLEIKDKTLKKIIKRNIILFLYKFYPTQKIISILRNKNRG